MAHALDIRLQGRGTAVLLLHGLTGTPVELRVLARALAADGHTVHAPVLPGRCTRPDDMDDLCWEDWMRAAVDEYDALAREHEHVIVGGQSAGATMALDLALRRDVAALLLYAPALAIARRGAYLARYFWRIVRRWPAPPCDMVIPDPECTTYDPAPVRAVSELIGGIARVRGRLGAITAPTFIAHSRTDSFVPVRCAEELATRLGGHVELLLLDGTGHAVTADAKREDVAEASRLFVARCLEVADLRSA